MCGVKCAEQCCECRSTCKKLTLKNYEHSEVGKLSRRVI